MARSVIWKGLDANSMEFCSIHFHDWITVKSSIVGCCDDIPFKVDYELDYRRLWFQGKVR